MILGFDQCQAFFGLYFAEQKLGKKCTGLGIFFGAW